MDAFSIAVVERLMPLLRRRGIRMSDRVLRQMCERHDIVVLKRGRYYDACEQMRCGDMTYPVFILAQGCKSRSAAMELAIVRVVKESAQLKGCVR